MHDKSLSCRFSRYRCGVDVNKRRRLVAPTVTWSVRATYSNTKCDFKLSTCTEWCIAQFCLGFLRLVFSNQQQDRCNRRSGQPRGSERPHIVRSAGNCQLNPQFRIFDSLNVSGWPSKRYIHRYIDRCIGFASRVSHHIHFNQ
jgi:hypothetical protein